MAHAAETCLMLMMTKKNNANNDIAHFTFGPRQANLCLRAFRHDKF